MDSHILINLFHILIVGGLFLYVGINRYKIYKPIFSILFYLGLVIILYHLYKTYGYTSSGKGFWVNLIHILIIAPFLIYIGYNGENTSRKFFDLLHILKF